MVALIDYGAGNIKSVENAVKVLGYEAILTSDPKVILQADHVILPGVGAFGDAMKRINDMGLTEVIRKAAFSGKPFLGICLGQQLLFEESEEGQTADGQNVKGLGILPGKIIRIPDNGLKIPQIGWNDLSFQRQGRLYKNVPAHSYVYFVHSYYLPYTNEEYVTATTEYGVTIGASVESGNVFACQFHPEKSEKVGMQILKNFLEI